MTAAGHRLATLVTLLAAIAWSSLTAAATSAERPASIVRVDPTGAVVWRTAWPPEGPADVELKSPVWFPIVPEDGLRAVDATGPPPDPVRGAVTLLDFWASWCAPCLIELPHLQDIHDRLEDRGLRVVAVNVDDPTETLLDTAGDLGLTVELARPTDRLRAIARPRSLPTLLLIDAGGRMRNRWDGYRPGLEKVVERSVRDLLDDPAPPAPVVVATAEDLASSYRIRWSRETGEPLEGLAFDARTAAPRILAATGREVVAFDRDGRRSGRASMAEGTGRIVTADLTGDGRDELVFWRPGSPSIRVLDMAERATASFEADGAVFDVAVLPPENPPGRSNLTLATTAGLRIHSVQGHLLAVVDAPARGVAVSTWTGLDRPSPGYVTADGTVVRIAPDGTVASTVESRSPADRLVPVDDAAVLIPGMTAGWTYTEPTRDEIAAYREDGVLVVFATGTGEIRWRSSWPDGIAQVIAGDLDGDGTAELIVASGERVVVLEATGRSDVPPGPVETTRP